MIRKNLNTVNKKKRKNKMKITLLKKLSSSSPTFNRCALPC